MAEIHKIPGETEKAFQAFNCYVSNKGKLDLKELAKITGSGISNIKRWCRQWNWESRLGKQISADTMAESIDINAKLKSITDKQAGQYIAITESFQELLNNIRQQLDSGAGRFQELDLKELVSYTRIIADTIPELLSRLNSINQANEARDNNPLIDEIMSNPEAINRLSDLLTNIRGEE